MYRIVFRVVAVVAVMGMLVGSGTGWSRAARPLPRSAAGSTHAVLGSKITFATDPSMHGGGDQGMDNLYTLDTYLCTDGIAVHVAYQALGDLGNSVSGHALEIGNVQDYGNISAPGAPVTNASSPSAQVALAGNVPFPVTLFTSPQNYSASASPPTNTDSTWTGQTEAINFAAPEAVGAQVVASIWRLDHGMILNEDDDAGTSNNNTTNGDDTGTYGGWGGTYDDGANGAPSPVGGGGDGDFAPNTDGSSFDDILRTDQQPADLTSQDPNSSPSFLVTPNPSTSLVEDCVINHAAPVTTVSYSPANPNSRGWYTVPVTITLIPHKVYYAAQTLTLHYSLDGGQTWQTSPYSANPAPKATVTLSNDGTYAFQYYWTDDQGDGSATDPQTLPTIQIDQTPPSITITTPVNGGTYLLNQPVASSYSCADGGSGVASCVGPVASGAALDTSSAGGKTFTVNAGDSAGNSATAYAPYQVQYGGAGTTCDGAPGHTILQPINADGSSVFKLGSTVAAKFRVCDANGVSIGATGVVTSFKLIKTTTSTSSTVDEAVNSTTPDTAFRWDATNQQWIFNISTKGLTAGTNYYYEITLNDGTTIDFNFAVR